MQVIMDETHDGGHSVMIDLENDGSLGERGEIGKEDTVKNNSSYSVTCSEGSSLLQSSEEQEPHNESQDGDDNARDHIRDEDDSDNASLVSVTDSTSLGTTNASSGETHATGKTTELPKTCLVSIARFLGFCSLVAGTTFAGMMMKTYASERKDEELEDEVSIVVTVLEFQASVGRNTRLINVSWFIGGPIVLRYGFGINSKCSTSSPSCTQCHGDHEFHRTCYLSWTILAFCNTS